jgi:integrase/recombinase XerC
MNSARLLKQFLEAKGILTAKAYRQDLEDLRLQLKAPTTTRAVEKLFGGSHQAAQALVSSYLAAMKRRGLAPATINRRLSMLRSLGKKARVLGYTEWRLEAENVRAEKVRNTKGPGRENIVMMFEFLKAQSATRPALRDLAIFRMCYDLGLRRGEICELNVSDIVAEGLRVRRKGKLSKQALVLPAATRSALEAWLEVRGPKPGPLFINFDEIHRSKTGKRLTGSAIYAIVKTRGQEAGVKVPVRPHGIRHTAITDARAAAAKRGHGLDDLVDFSGHADVRTLKHYLDDEKSIQGTISSDIALPE